MTSPRGSQCGGLAASKPPEPEEPAPYSPPDEFEQLADADEAEVVEPPAKVIKLHPRQWHKV